MLFGGATDGVALRDVSSLDGSNGFKISGATDGDFTGVSVDSAGDFNGDGDDDLLISAPGADQGMVHVVFGSDANPGAVLSLSALNGHNGMRISGLASEIAFGYASHAGAVNGDGFDDILVAGVDSAYVIFGAAYGRAEGTPIGGAGDDALIGAAGREGLIGGAGDNSLTLNARDVLALPDRANVFTSHGGRQLLIDGDAGDSVLSSGEGWMAGEALELGATVYATYTVAGSTAMLLVDTAITQSIT